MRTPYIPSMILVCMMCLASPGQAQDTLMNKVELKIRERQSIDDKGYKTIWHEYIDEFGESIRHGALDTFYPGGKKFNAMTFSYGQLEGETTTWHENGQVKTVGQFKDNHKSGMWRHFHEDGSLYREIEYLNDRPQGTYFKRHENGKPHEQGFFSKGRRDGFWTTWYRSGQKRSEGKFIGGKRDSTWTWWHENGQVSSHGIMKMDQRVFDWQDWFENGQTQKIYNYDSLGMMQGSYREYYPDGSTKVEGFSVNGKKDGLWREWDDKGNLIVNRRFNEGELQTDSTAIDK